MPRRAQPPRLYLRRDENVWIIRDGSQSIRTGCGLEDRAGAEKALGAYLASKFTPVVYERDPDRLTVAEVLAAYGREHAPSTRGAATIGYNIAALLPFWGPKKLSDVRAPACREYGRWRQRSDGTVRRELGTLGAAIQHWHRNHGPLNSVPSVTLPKSPEPSPHFLTRREAALLLAGALGFYLERWCDLTTGQEHHRWRRDHNRIQRHAARFIILGLGTGNRPGVTTAVRWSPSSSVGHVDVGRGVIHRRGLVEVQTNKRKPPARLGRKLLGHLRRWQRIDAAACEKLRAAGGDEGKFETVVHYEGDPVLKIRRSWASAVELAGLGPEVTPHILRHTRATWLMQNAVDPWEAAGQLGMTVQVLEKVYGHHHPDFQRRAAEV
jgi:integrase